VNRIQRRRTRGKYTGENITDINQTEWIISDDKKTISKESVSMSDNGLAFTCKAENRFGSVDTSLAITVNEQPTTTAAPVTNQISSGAAKGAFVYSIIGVICLIVAIAGFALLRRVVFTKKAVYKTDGDKDETHESLKDDELEAGKKKEYFM